MNKKYSHQRKTTLKSNTNGDLCEIDMLRILDKISAAELNQCELSCNLDSQTLRKKYIISFDLILKKQITTYKYFELI